MCGDVGCMWDIGGGLMVLCVLLPSLNTVAAAFDRANKKKKTKEDFDGDFFIKIINQPNTQPHTRTTYQHPHSSYPSTAKIGKFATICVVQSRSNSTFFLYIV
jgi:hypothetical protein